MELSTLQGGLSRWFEIPNTSVSVLIKLPTRGELLEDHKQITGKNGNRMDNKKWFTIVAKKYILGVKGLTYNGVETEYTVEIGFSLMDNQLTGPFIDKMLGASEEWSDEGNALSETD